MSLSTPTVAPTKDEFLEDFPEFGPATPGGPSIFAPSAINYWLQFAQYAVSNTTRWGSWYYTIIELIAAHYLSLEAWAAQGSPANQQLIPGLAKGAIASKSAGDVSIVYDRASVAEPGGMQWNYTTYGGRAYHLFQLVGMGPLQVGPQGCAGPNNGPGWPGPWTYNFPNPSQ